MLKPETIQHTPIVRILSGQRSVSANTDRAYDPFIGVVKARRYQWNGAWWQKDFYDFESPADRAAELCAALLEKGFVVDCDDVIAEKAVHGYAPAITRRVMVFASGAHAGNFSIWWKHPDDFYRQGLFLPGSQYNPDTKTVAVPAEFANEVAGFAELHAFSISDKARELIASAPTAVTVIPAVSAEERATWQRPTLAAADPHVPARLRDAQYVDFGLRTDLLPHQVPAVDKLLPLKVGGLFMDMGLGKTRTAIQLAWARRHRISSVVWFCPCSLKETVAYEIEKHTDCQAVYVFGDKTAPANLLPAFWYVVGLESVGGSDRVFLAVNQVLDERSFVIVDESSYIKGYTAKRTRRLTEVCRNTAYRLLLTGTPLSQGPEDLYAQMTFLDQEILGYSSFYSFAANHLEYHPDYPGMVVRAHNTDYLATKIAPYVYQVTKEECLNLPEKLFDRRYYALTSEQQEYYQQAKEEILLSVPEQDLDSFVIFQLFGALQQIVSGFWNRDGKLIEIPHRRVEVLREVLERLPEGEKVLIWCKYLHSVRQIAGALPGARLYHGEMSATERAAALARWRAEGRYLVVTLGTGGHGLTLTEAAYAVYYEQGFKYSERIQSEDRIHRIGQERHPTYIDIYARCGIESRIEDALSRKEDVVKAFRREVNKAKDKYAKVGEL